MLTHPPSDPAGAHRLDYMLPAGEEAVGEPVSVGYRQAQLLRWLPLYCTVDVFCSGIRVEAHDKHPKQLRVHGSAIDLHRARR